MASETTKRDLRTGRSLWSDSPGLGVPVRPLQEAIAVDVAIVGAGLSGAFMARELARDHSIAVLDRRPPLMGSTIASAALLQWEIDLPLTVLGRSVGEKRAQRAYLRSRSAVADLARIVGGDRIVCGLKDKRSLYLSGETHGAAALEAEAEARAAIGLESVYLSGPQLREGFGIDRAGAILSGGSASGDPARLAAGLLRRAVADKATIYSPVDVLEAISDRSGVTLLTDTGHNIRADRVIFCSGYEFPDGVVTSGMTVRSTWALASKPRTRRPAWLKDVLVWEASDPYLYFRMARDGRLIVGGEDEPASPSHADHPLLKRKCEVLSAKLQTLLPEARFEVDYTWAGTFSESATGLPSIGRVPGMPNAWAVMGVGGNGVTNSVIAAQIVAAEVRGGSDPDADLYRP